MSDHKTQQESNATPEVRPAPAASTVRYIPSAHRELTIRLAQEQHARAMRRARLDAMGVRG